MKRAPYISATELQEFLKLGAVADLCEVMLTTTTDKEWLKRLRTANTHLHTLVNERVACLDPKQIKSLLRRKEHTAIRLYTSDEVRIDDEKYKVGVPYEKVTMDIEDLQDMAELALCACQACPQGQCVEKCKFRETMHRLGIPVARDCITKWECEFRSDNEVRHIAPAEIEQKIEVI